MLRIKKINAVLTTFLMAVFSAGCNGDADVERFVQACLTASNLDEEICECTANLAKEELSPTGFEFVIAGLQNDDDRTEELRGQMAIEEIMSAGLFFVNGPARCAEQDANS